MGLILCPDCKNEISLKADACPKCGFPLTVHTLSAEQAPIQLSSVDPEHLWGTLDLRTSSTYVDSLEGKDGEIPLIHDKFMSALKAHQGFRYLVAEAMGYSLTTLFGREKTPEEVLEGVVVSLESMPEIGQVFWMALGVSQCIGNDDGRFDGKLTIGESMEELENMMKRGVTDDLLTEEEYKQWSQ